MKLTRTIPIVMVHPGDPAASGIVASLERPGGNVTGVSGLVGELGGKWLELLKETVPGVSRVAVFWSRASEASISTRKEVEVAARYLPVELQWVEVSGPSNTSTDYLEAAFGAAIRGRAGALVVLPGIVFVTNTSRIAELALKNRLPAIFWRADFAEAGGLMAYGPDHIDRFRRAAYIVDKILKGAKPAELPIQLPTKFELVINLKTAQELGITIPHNVLIWADRVIK